MVVEEKSSRDKYNKTFFNAFKCHTFILDNVLEYSLEEGFFISKNKSPRRLNDDDIDYVLVFFLLASILTFLALIITEFKVGPSALLATFMAGVYTRMTLNQQRINTENALSLPAVTNFFDENNLHLKTKTSNLNVQNRITLKPEFKDKSTSSYRYETRAIVTLQKVITKINSISCPYEKNIFTTVLAMKSKADLYEKVPNTYKYYKFINEIEVGHLTKLLNKAENLCQGIYYNIYNEALIQNYLGSDLRTVTSVLLPYIYARREIHAKRIASQEEVLQQYTLSHEYMYVHAPETHDLLYEYLEYYNYRWYWSNSKGAGKKPVRFEIFHEQLKHAYTALASYYRANKNEQNTPYISYALQEFSRLK